MLVPVLEMASRQATFPGKFLTLLFPFKALSVFGKLSSAFGHKKIFAGTGFEEEVKETTT